MPDFSTRLPMVTAGELVSQRHIQGLPIETAGELVSQRYIQVLLLNHLVRYRAVSRRPSRDWGTGISKAHSRDVVRNNCTTFDSVAKSISGYEHTINNANQEEQESEEKTEDSKGVIEALVDQLLSKMYQSKVDIIKLHVNRAALLTPEDRLIYNIIVIEPIATIIDAIIDFAMGIFGLVTGVAEAISSIFGIVNAILAFLDGLSGLMYIGVEFAFHPEDTQNTLRVVALGEAIKGVPSAVSQALKQWELKFEQAPMGKQAFVIGEAFGAIEVILVAAGSVAKKLFGNVGKAAISVEEEIAAGGALSLRPDIILSGGRSGQLVKDLIGPPNSVVRGGGARAFITNEQGQVILDITASRVKPVTPGEGFGPKRPPSTEELNLLNRVQRGDK
jgi:hypothetical protein